MALQLSQGKEDANFKRSATRIIAGVTADVWGPIGFLAGFQQYEKKFENGYGIYNPDDGALLASVTKATEQLLLAGIRVKLAPLSYLSVQYGMLKNELEYNAFGANGAPLLDASGNPAGPKTVSISKNVLMADVTVNF